MTARRDLKSIIRDRQHKTGVSYTAARVHVMRDRAQLLGIPDEAASTASIERPTRVEAAVLKVGTASVRIRIVGEDGQITLRSHDVWKLAPGHIITARIEKRWTFRGDAYASGRIEEVRIDVARLGLVPLPLTGGELEDLRTCYEPVRRPDPYAPLWRRLTAKPRPWYEMDGIAWAAFPGEDPDECPMN